MICSVLSDSQISRIHNASLDILDRVGVEIPHKQMLSLFEQAGADVDRKTHRVRIPGDLVEKSLEQAGKQYTIYGRDLSRKAEFGMGKRNYNCIAGEASWVDEIGTQRRYATLGDVADACRLADALEGITIPAAMADPHELPVGYRCVEVLATLIKNTTKPLTFWLHDRASAKYLVDMTIALRGSEAAAIEHPLWYPFLEPISPLRFPVDGIDLLFETARLNTPVHTGPMAQMGVSAPGTVAGTMAVENAEILAAICIIQLIKPGTPVCYGGICHAFDMQTTQMIFGGPEQALFGVGMTQMGKHYGLPVYVNVGLTDSKRPDAQAGIESGITLMLAAAAGADIFGHLGICGVDQATSLDMLVMQNELISYVESAMRDIDFSDDAFGLDVIEEVGPGGMFIDQMHTVEHFRKELWFPKLMDRQYYQRWLDGGAQSMEDRCVAHRKELLENHEVEPLSPEMERMLDEIVAAAKKELT